MDRPSECAIFNSLLQDMGYSNQVEAVWSTEKLPENPRVSPRRGRQSLFLLLSNSNRDIDNPIASKSWCRCAADIRDLKGKGKRSGYPLFLLLKEIEKDLIDILIL
jgi:hypothetical protein